MTKEEAWKVIEHLKTWNQSQKPLDAEVQPLVDAKRELLIKAYKCLGEDETE